MRPHLATLTLPFWVSLAFGRPSKTGERSTFSRAEFKYPWERGAILDFGDGRGGKTTAGFKTVLAVPGRAFGTWNMDERRAEILGSHRDGLKMRHDELCGRIFPLNSARRLQTLQKRRVPSLSSLPSF